MFMARKVVVNEPGQETGMGGMAWTMVVCQGRTGFPAHHMRIMRRCVVKRPHRMVVSSGGSLLDVMVEMP